MTLQKHGGSDNHITINFREDFSVTTNVLGPNKDALRSLNLETIKYYPPQNYQPYIDNLKKYLFKTDINIILGNGASELIDLLIRNIPGDSWRPSYCDVQYLEYERSATNAGKIKKIWNLLNNI